MPRFFDTCQRAPALSAVQFGLRTWTFRGFSFLNLAVLGSRSLPPQGTTDTVARGPCLLQPEGFQLAVCAYFTERSFLDLLESAAPSHQLQKTKTLPPSGRIFD